MTAAELKQARLRLGLNIKKMAETMKMPYRTYQNYELGLVRVPGVVEVAVTLLLKG